MTVTVDTSVIFAGLYSKSGASHQILKLILDGRLRLALSTNVYFEYYDVLTRNENLNKLNLTVPDVENLLDLIALMAKKHAIYYLLRPNLIDESDNLFIECAFASNSQFLITSNIRDFTSGELKGFEFDIITPGDFLRHWRQHNE